MSSIPENHPAYKVAAAVSEKLETDRLLNKEDYVALVDEANQDRLVDPKEHFASKPSKVSADGVDKLQAFVKKLDAAQEIKALGSQVVDMGERESEAVWSKDDLHFRLAQPAAVSNATKALDAQVGGDHYKGNAIQPVEFSFRNNLNFLEGSVVKYICRHRGKNKAEDLRKAIHYIQLLIELEYPECQPAYGCKADKCCKNGHQD